MASPPRETLRHAPPLAAGLRLLGGGEHGYSPDLGGLRQKTRLEKSEKGWKTKKKKRGREEDEWPLS